MDARIVIVQGNIVEREVEALVNAANQTLLGGGGVDGAIHRAAGPELLEECRRLGGCRTGEAKLTRGYRLKAKWVIHTVGPVWQGGDAQEDELLASCYRNSLRVADENGIKSLAFPAISTGAFGFPLDRAARIAIQETQTHLASSPKIAFVEFVCFDRDSRTIYEATLAEGYLRG